MLLLSAFHRTIDQASISRWRGIVGRIENRGTALESLSDSELRKKSLALKYDALSGKPIDDLVIPAFSLVREAGRRTIGLRHYPVQLLGGVAMHFGNIAVMSIECCPCIENQPYNSLEAQSSKG